MDSESGIKPGPEGSLFYQRRSVVILLNIAVTVMAVLFFIWLDRKAESSRQVPQLPAGINVAAIYRVSRQQDIFPIYEKAGLWGARVVHLNRFFNMQDYSPKKQFVTTPFPVRVLGMRQAYEPGIDSHTWLFIATRTGLVRTMTTVLPDQIFTERVKKAPGDRIFTFADGSIRGFTLDIPRIITNLDGLQVIDEPVVVNVDAGYFGGGADPSQTAVILKEKCRDVRMLVLIDSVDEPEVTDEMREQLRAFQTAWNRK